LSASLALWVHSLWGNLPPLHITLNNHQSQHQDAETLSNLRNQHQDILQTDATPQYVLRQ